MGKKINSTIQDYKTEAELFIPNAPYKKESRVWRIWKDFDKDCQNTRHEVLILYHIDDTPLIFSDKNHCQVKSGKWLMPFIGSIYEGKGNHIDIDHLVALNYASTIDINAYENQLKVKYFWSKYTGIQLANDIDNLIPSHRKANREKSNKGVVDWLPKNISFIPFFLKRIKFIKEKYALPFSKEEIKLYIKYAITHKENF